MDKKGGITSLILSTALSLSFQTSFAQETRIDSNNCSVFHVNGENYCIDAVKNNDNIYIQGLHGDPKTVEYVFNKLDLECGNDVMLTLPSYAGFTNDIHTFNVSRGKVGNYTWEIIKSKGNEGPDVKGIGMKATFVDKEDKNLEKPYFGILVDIISEKNPFTGPGLGNTSDQFHPDFVSGQRGSFEKLHPTYSSHNAQYKKTINVGEKYSFPVSLGGNKHFMPVKLMELYGQEMNATFNLLEKGEPIKCETRIKDTIHPKQKSLLNISENKVKEKKQFKIPTLKNIVVDKKEPILEKKIKVITPIKDKINVVNQKNTVPELITLEPKVELKTPTKQTNKQIRPEIVKVEELPEVPVKYEGFELEDNPKKSSSDLVRQMIRNSLTRD